MKPSLIIPIRNATKFGFKDPFNKEDIQDFKNYYDQVNKEYDDFFDFYMAKKQMTFTGRRYTIPCMDRKVDVEILPEKVRQERRELRNRAREVLFNDCVEETQGQYKASQLRHAKKKDARDYPALFFDLEKDGTELINGSTIAKHLEDTGSDSFDSATRNSMFRGHLKNLMDTLIKYTKPCSDEEYLKNYKLVNSCALAFMGDHVVTGFKDFAHCDMEDETRDLYNNYKTYAQQVYNSHHLRMARLTDPSYEYMLDDDLDALGLAVYQTDELIDKYIESLNEKTRTLKSNKTSS